MGHSLGGALSLPLRPLFCVLNRPFLYLGRFCLDLIYKSSLLDASPGVRDAWSPGVSWINVFLLFWSLYPFTFYKVFDNIKMLRDEWLDNSPKGLKEIKHD